MDSRGGFSRGILKDGFSKDGFPFKFGTTVCGSFFFFSENVRVLSNLGRLCADHYFFSPRKCTFRYLLNICSLIFIDVHWFSLIFIDSDRINPCYEPEPVTNRNRWNRNRIRPTLGSNETESNRTDGFLQFLQPFRTDVGWELQDGLQTSALLMSFSPASWSMTCTACRGSYATHDLIKIRLPQSACF